MTDGQDAGTLLHVRCGQKRLRDLPDYFAGWREIRYDIDERCNPDIQGDITDLSAIKSGSIDGIWSSHTIEHLFAHEAPVAIAEFHRILTNNGFLTVTCPDLKSACRVAGKKGGTPRSTPPACVRSRRETSCLAINGQSVLATNADLTTDEACNHLSEIKPGRLEVA